MEPSDPEFEAMYESLKVRPPYEWPEILPPGMRERLLDFRNNLAKPQPINPGREVEELLAAGPKGWVRSEAGFIRVAALMAIEARRLGSEAGFGVWGLAGDGTPVRLHVGPYRVREQADQAATALVRAIAAS